MALEAAAACVEINQCVGCTFLGDDVAVAGSRSSGEENFDRHAIGGAGRIDGVEVDAMIRHAP